MKNTIQTTLNLGMSPKSTPKTYPNLTSWLEDSLVKHFLLQDREEGLMTAEGHVVTMPLYKDIEAMGPDLYLCTSTNYDKVIVNGKGEIVK